MAGRTIAEAASEQETFTRDPLMLHRAIVTQDRLCSEMLAAFMCPALKADCPLTAQLRKFSFAPYFRSFVVLALQPESCRSLKIRRRQFGSTIFVRVSSECFLYQHLYRRQMVELNEFRYLKRLQICSATNRSTRRVSCLPY